MAHTIQKPLYPVYIADAATAVGHEEFAGPLGAFFDLHDPKKDDFGMDTWEKAESEMQRLAVNTLLGRNHLQSGDISAVFAGDLLNQCTGSGYGLLSFGIPFFGLYGACSTAAEGLALGSLLCGAYGGRVVTVSSSHFCSAERQFRFPMEYGGQRPPTSQWTVTGAAAFLLTGDAPPDTPRIAEVLPGITVDRGITDANNLGAAMAPAAADTIVRYLRESGRSPDSFDRILTGDLGREGSAILCELTAAQGFDISAVHDDCGNMIYDADASDKHAGGSGCGCSGVTVGGYILSEMRRGVLRDVLFIGTGALLSPMSVQQGQSIPGIGHLVRLTAEREDA
ncbi:MAG: stage V sporulation protein AD [Clostridia bacterium]|nr:stage V sporulation protein AD [Clostridia bacterium]